MDRVESCFRDRICVIPTPDPFSDITSEACKGVVGPYCSGSGYRDPRCMYAIYRNIYRNDEIFCNLGQYEEYNAQGIEWSRRIVGEVTSDLVSHGYFIGSRMDSSTYSSYWDSLYDNVCKDHPVVCTKMLDQYCKVYTTDDVKKSSDVLRFCGCYLDRREYSRYVDRYGINDVCTPMCSFKSIPQLDVNNKPIVCTTDVCVINDISVSIINSSTGDINFNQICGGCDAVSGTSSCQCFMEDNTFITINSAIQGNINFNQRCSSSSVCTVGGTPTDCNVLRTNSSNYMIAIVVILVMMLLIYMISRWRS